MNTKQVIAIVKVVSGVSFRQMKIQRRGEEFNARLLAIVLLHEEGFHHSDIAKLFGVKRPAIYGNLKRINDMLSWDKQFKKQYLACIQQITAMEDAA